ncbi:hypothetical protein HMPREF1982_02771 [Clostridiales bacterium oral taxon 876 str. F0540]|nr:hypothetical protein HMPREF1982_02771 [Clostridiales bacterium oral taxon 876 str. F0540]
MAKKELTCISCPLGCNLEVDIIDENNIKVTGNSCKRGEAYGIKECTNPTRIVTSTVLVKNGVEEVVPVKTEKDIPKDKIFDCIRALKGLSLEAPIKIGDVVIENIFDTGVNIVATKNVGVI